MMWIEPGDPFPHYGSTLQTSEVFTSLYSYTLNRTATGTNAPTRTTSSQEEYVVHVSSTFATTSSVDVGRETAVVSFMGENGSSSESYSEGDGVNPNTSYEGNSSTERSGITLRLTSVDPTGRTSITTVYETVTLTHNATNRIGTLSSTTASSTSSITSTSSSATGTTHSTYGSINTATTTYEQFLTTWEETTEEETLISTTSYVDGSQTIYTTTYSTAERSWRQGDLYLTTLTAETTSSTSAVLPDIVMEYNTVLVAQSCGQLYTVEWCVPVGQTTTTETNLSSVSTSTYTKWFTSDTTSITTITLGGETVTAITIVGTTTSGEFTRFSSVTYTSTRTMENNPQCTDYDLVTEGSTVWTPEIDTSETAETTTTSSTSETSGTSSGASATTQRGTFSTNEQTVRGTFNLNTCHKGSQIRPCLITQYLD